MKSQKMRYAKSSMKRRRPKPVIIDADVEPVEVETRALVVRRPEGQACATDPEAGAWLRAALEAPRGPDPERPGVDPTGRLDILAYRLASGYALPCAESVMGVPGLARVLEPFAEAFIAEHVPAKNILKAPKPRRRLR